MKGSVRANPCEPRARLKTHLAFGIVTQMHLDLSVDAVAALAVLRDRRIYFLILWVSGKQIKGQEYKG